MLFCVYYRKIMNLRFVRMKDHKYYKLIFEKYKNINYRFKNFLFLEK